MCPGITGSVDSLIREILPVGKYYRSGKCYRPGREPVRGMVASAKAWFMITIVLI